MMAFSLSGYENSVITGIFALLGASVGFVSNYFVQRMMQGKQDERERIMHQRAVQKEKSERLRAQYARLVRSAKIMEGYLISSMMRWSGETEEMHKERNADTLRQAFDGIAETRTAMSVEDDETQAIVAIYDDIDSAFHQWGRMENMNKTDPRSFPFDDVQATKKKVQEGSDLLQQRARAHLNKLEQA